MKKYSNKLLTLAGIAILGLTACKKNNYVIDKDPIIPMSVAKFNFNTNSAADSIVPYGISSSNNVLKVPIGSSNVKDYDRTVSIDVDYGTAVQGVQINAVPTSLVIPAGSAVDSLPVSAIFSGYSDASRLDVVTLTIVESSDFQASFYKKKVKIQIRQFCDDNAPIDAATMSSFMGDYDNTGDVYAWDPTPYGPYSTSITSATLTGATTGKISVNNLFDDGWGDVEFNLDWTNMPTKSTEVVENDVPDSDAGSIFNGGDGMLLTVRPFAGDPKGSFSPCAGKFILKFQIGVGAVNAWFDDVVMTATLQR